MNAFIDVELIAVGIGLVGIQLVYASCKHVTSLSPASPLSASLF